jgi:hypothetical protein
MQENLLFCVFYLPNQGRTGYFGNAAIATRLFFNNAWHFKNILRRFEAFLSELRLFFLRSSILKTFSEKSRLFLINVRDFQ